MTDQPIFMDVNFIREAARVFTYHGIPLTWHVRLGVEFPAIASPTEFIGKPFNDPKKLYRKTLSVGSPTEVQNDDLLTIDQATGLRIVFSKVHLPFLQGQRVVLSDQMKVVLADAIRQRTARDRSTTLRTPPDDCDPVTSLAAEDEKTDAAGPAVGDTETDAVSDGSDQEGKTGDL